MMEATLLATNVLPLWYICIGLFGLIIGSFLNVVILRLNTGKGSGGRSMCLSCTKPLTWIELIPILSFFMLGRRCRECKSSLSWQYPLVEIGTALLFVLILWRMQSILIVDGFYPFILQLLLLLAGWSMLVIIFVYDLYHKIIPNVLSYTLAGCMFIYQVVLIQSGDSFTSADIWNLLAGPLFFLPFWSLWYISRGKWLGLGDGKLALSIGWMLGLRVGATALILSVWIGALVGVALVLVAGLSKWGSGITIKSEMPFAPFLIIGMLISFLLPMDFLQLSLLFSVL